MPVPPPTEPQRQGLLREGVHARLQEAIVDGTLAPGERVRDGDLAKWLGVSRTPVREALLKLSASGLVEATPGRSTRITPLDRVSIHDAQVVVAAMHRLAVLEAVAHLGPADLAEMRAANERFRAAIEAPDVDAALSADDAFHAVAVRVAGNSAVAAVIDQFTPVIRRLERAHFASHAASGSVDLHSQLLDRLEAGDAEGAARVSDQTWHNLESLLDSLSPTDDAQDKDI